ncbi:SpoIIE family protein phosphatase [Streptomyces sp. NPDC002845]
MQDIWGDRDVVAQGRARVLAGERAVTSLRPPVLRSWRRCQSLGLAPDVIAPPYQSDLHLDGRLFRAAAPVLEQLESEVAGTRVALVLADRHGVILHCGAGEKALYKHLEAVRLAPGFNYSEQYVGTHGIGTTLEERRDFHAFGAEHFADCLQPFASAGATVRDPLSGRLEGVVGLTAWCSDADTAMAARIREVAETVEQRLLEQRTGRERALFEEVMRVEHGGRGAMVDAEPSLALPDDTVLTDSDRLVLWEKATELISAARSTVVQVPLSGGRLATLACRSVAGSTGEDGVAVTVSLPRDAPPHQVVTAASGLRQHTADAPPGGAREPRQGHENSTAETAGTIGAAGAAGTIGAAQAAGTVGAVGTSETSGPARTRAPDAPAERLLSVGHREMGQLAMAARERLELLYDAGVRIGTTLDVTRTAQELAEMVVPRFADIVTVDLLEPVLHGDEPLTPDVPLLRAAMGTRHADPPFVPVGRRVSFASASPQAQCFAGGEAVLEPDLSAVPEWQAQDADRVQEILRYGIRSLISVSVCTRGTVLGLVSFYRTQESEPFEEDDLHLAEELIARVAMAIDNARRFTREQTIALTLQRSLLPGLLPEQTAVDVAHRYLPAQAGVGGVGGDWFDIIPLSGTRVALVVGDVVGHGLHAAVTMGRLRTAVHNFATLDLPPDELLGRLDDLVIALDQEEAGRPGGGDIIGATCLYAIYDPVSERCAVARAGHPPPVVVRPDGSVHIPDLPVGPPLGLGGLPFETAELPLPEGSQLVLYTDGLIEDPDWDVDYALEQLQLALAHPDRPPEQTCDAILEALSGPRVTDDVTLLVARTRALKAEHTASWEVPSDPAAVSGVRSAAERKLTEWGLDACTFTTELLLSELVTNAIRHASGPIHVRLLRDRALICEVSDASSTSPHLRNATATDEGGRGLFLVAQLAQRWGTRYTPRGKVIWTEQPLSPAPSLELSSW